MSSVAGANLALTMTFGPLHIQSKDNMMEMSRMKGATAVVASKMSQVILLLPSQDK